MKEILIIECMSSGRMYVDEAIARGYKALVVNPECSDDHMTAAKNKAFEEFSKKYTSDQYECINAPNDCDAVCKLVEGRDIAACVVGSEYGVRLTDQVARRLGFLGNDPNTTWRRCTKHGMIQSLEENNIRAIKSKVIETEDDIVSFWQSNPSQKAFMKFSESAAGYANKTCNSMEESIAYLEYVKSIPNYFGNSDDQILIQEFIEGIEYVVNTVSFNGKHMLTDLWQYTKVMNDTGQVIYQSSKLIVNLDEKMKNLVNYAFKVLDACDFKYGPCHGEYKIDAAGPVLIETNARPMGDSMTRDYMLDILGHCIVDLSLDSVMDTNKYGPEKFDLANYKPLQSSVKKYIILNKDVRGDLGPAFAIAENLKTYHNHFDYEPSGVKQYTKTKDLGNTPMILKIASPNEEDVLHDLNFMNALESAFSQLIVAENPNFKCEDCEDIQQIVDNFQEEKCFENPAQACRTLIITDDDAYEYINGTATPVSENTPTIFDCVYFADGRDMKLEKKLRDIIAALRYLKPGGKVKVSDGIANALPYGNQTLDVLCQVVRV